jgi:APA family basic amino acid/polyamine antiporter
LNNAAPVAHALIQIGYNFGASVVSVGAIAGLSTVCLVMFYGLTRVMFAMSYDGLLPPVFSRVNVKTQTPIQVIIVCGFLIALVAGLTPIEQVAEIVNIGTLSAFVIVSAGVLVLRYTKPDLIRPFRVPFSPVVPLLGMGFCLYLMMNLPGVTWMRFLMWMFLGLIFYFAYGRTHSKLHAN